MPRRLHLQRIWPHQAFLALLFLSILTLWIEQFWPVTLFLTGTFLLTARSLISRTTPRNPLAWRVTLLLCVLPLEAGLQLLFHTTVYPENTWIALLASLSYPCVIFLLSDLSPQQVHQSQSAMIWFAFILSVTAILQYYTAGGKIFWLWDAPDDIRAMGPILSRNHFAAFVEVVLPIAIYRALRLPDSLWLYSTMAGTLYASVIACASRAGMVICTLELIIVPMLLMRQRVRLRGAGRALLPVFGTVALLTMVVGPEVVIDRLMAPDPYSMRKDLIEPSLAMVREHSALGLGAGNWPVVYPQYATMDFGVFINQAHNDWLQWVGEGGFLSAAVFVLLALVAGRQALWSPWAAGVPAVLCHAFLDYPFSRPALAAWTLGFFTLSFTINRVAISPAESLRSKQLGRKKTAPFSPADDSRKWPS